MAAVLNSPSLTNGLALGRSERLAVFREAAPTGIGEALFARAAVERSVYYRDRSEGKLTYVGLGVAALVETSGEKRFDHASSALEGIWARFLDRPRDLRAFGGASFLPGRSSGLWSNFGETSFFLPSVTYIDRGDAAEFLFVTGAELAHGFADKAQELARSLRELATAPRGTTPPARAEFRALAPSSEEARPFLLLVRDIQASLAGGELDKVVAARKRTVELSGGVDLEAILERLARAGTHTTRFAYRVGEAVFLAATPETLVRKNGLSIETEALAGSFPGQLEDGEAKLLGSVKDQREHRIVVDAIVDALTPVTAALHFDETPRIRNLGRILHLHTPISGTLEAALPILSLVEALHPTPAVGGTPRQKALDWIRDHEQLDRGWYASPFGHVDAAGNGHFVVALRSALISGAKVEVFAGAGIVEESVPEDEFAETELKMTAMGLALGLLEAGQDVS